MGDGLSTPRRRKKKRRGKGRMLRLGDKGTRDALIASDPGEGKEGCWRCI